MNYETDVSKVNWSALKSDVGEAIEKVKAGWTVSQMGLPESEHKQMINSSYMPVLRLLAEFCLAANEMVQVEDAGDE